MSTRSPTAPAGRPARIPAPARRTTSCLLLAAALLVVPACAGGAKPRDGEPRPHAAGAGTDAGAPGADARDAVARHAERIEAFASALLEADETVSGERDALAGRWLALLATHPDHPLAEGALRLLLAAEVDLDDPAAFRRALLALDPDLPWTPLARGVLTAARSRAQVADAPLASLSSEDHFADHLAEAWVLAPLGPDSNPLAFAIDAGRLADPGLPRVHAGLLGEVAWRSWRRTPWQAALRPTDALPERRGWAEVLLPFVVDGGGPAFLEIRQPHGGGDSVAGGNGAVLSFGGSSFPALVGDDAPGYALALNGEPLTVLDRLDVERSAVQRAAVVLRDGGNRVHLRYRAELEPVFAVRVLDEHGRPHPGLRPGEAAPELGAVVDGGPPSQPLPDSESALRQVERGPAGEAFLGLLLLLDRRPAEGLQHLQLAAGAGRPRLTAWAAGAFAEASHLPAPVRDARARALVDEVLAGEPSHVAAGIARSARLAAEDKEEAAIGHLSELSALHPAQARTLVELSVVQQRLDMDFESGASLALARRRAPDSPRVLSLLVGSAARAGLERRATQLAEQAELLQGRDAGRLERLAWSRTRVGDREAAAELWDEALARGDDPQRRLRHVRWVLETGEAGRALELAEALAEAHPEWAAPALAAADAAHALARREAEVAWLRRTLDRRPSTSEARERLVDLGEGEPVEELFARYRVDPEQVLAAYDESGRDDSVVRLLDMAVVKVFPDGAVDTLTHELIQVRDLAACESQGTVRLSGDVLAISTRKPDGTRYEPVRVSGSYVMPNLEPGDVIETLTLERTSGPTPLVRPGRWYFQSLEQPFVTSRYVISLPKGLDELHCELHAYAGEHETLDAGDDLVHDFVVHDSPRVLPEAGMAPGDWFLPWVEFGMHDDPDAVLARLHAQLRPLVRATPELEQAAREICAGLEGDEAKARALHDAVTLRLDRRHEAPVPAGTTWLTKEGNAAVLYAALLAAADVPHEVVWSRDVPPEGDPEPVPYFVEATRLLRKLLVVVRPADGEEAWCDLSARTIPYGRMFGDAPGAEAVAALSRRPMRVPDHGPASRPGGRLELRCDVAADGSAAVAGTVWVRAGAGYRLAEQLRNAPADSRRFVVQSVATGFVPGLDLETGSVEGLDGGGSSGLAFRFEGGVPLFLDRAGGGYTRRLPLRPLELGSRVAVQGTRRLPWLGTDLVRDEGEVLLQLPSELVLVDPPPPVTLSYGGFRYELAVEPLGESEWVVRRTFEAEPFAVQPHEYEDLVRFAARVDDAERVRLSLQPR